MSTKSPTLRTGKVFAFGSGFVNGPGNTNESAANPTEIQVKSNTA